MTNTPEQNQNRQVPFTTAFKPVDLTEDILGLFNLFRRHWLIFAFFSIAGLIMGMTYARYSRDVFQSTAMLQLDTKSKSGKAIAEIGDLFESQSPALAEIHLIKSLSVLMPVVESLHLNYSAEPQGIVDRLMRREGRMDLDLFDPPVPLVAEKGKWIAEVKSSDSYELFSPLGASVVVGKVGETYRVPVGGDSVAICVKSIYALPGQKFALGSATVLEVAERLRTFSKFRIWTVTLIVPPTFSMLSPKCMCARMSKCAVPRRRSPLNSWKNSSLLSRQSWILPNNF